MYKIFFLAWSSSGDGALSIVKQPADNEVSYESIVESDTDNRTGIAINTRASGDLLQCSVTRTGMSSSEPVVSWIRNGELVTTSTGFESSLDITDFALSDAGVYQCVFTDTDNDTEILTTVPYRLDTGL